jgi:hypothetical protein
MSCKIENCSDKIHAKDLCAKHYRRNLRHGSPSANPLRSESNFTLKELFERSYEPITEAGCWLWKLSGNRFGYGRIYWNKKRSHAHRISYELHKGPLSEKDLVLHSCDTPACVNPEHLFVGDHLANSMDMYIKKRQNPPIGSRNRHAILNEEIVKDVILQLAQGFKARDLADKYNVHKSTIFNIKNKKTWRHVTGE